MHLNLHKVNIFTSFQYFFIKFEILLVHDMHYKSCYKNFLVNIVKFLVNHCRTVGYFEKAKNILQKSYVEIVYKNFYQKYLYEFLTKFNEIFFYFKKKCVCHRR